MLQYKRHPSQRRRREQGPGPSCVEQGKCDDKAREAPPALQLDASIMQAAGIDRDEVPGLRPMGLMHRHSSQGRDLSSTGLVGRAPV